jgi:hypothetical protein
MAILWQHSYAADRVWPLECRQLLQVHCSSMLASVNTHWCRRLHCMGLCNWWESVHHYCTTGSNGIHGPPLCPFMSNWGVQPLLHLTLVGTYLLPMYRGCARTPWLTQPWCLFNCSLLRCIKRGDTIRNRTLPACSCSSSQCDAQYGDYSVQSWSGPRRGAAFDPCRSSQEGQGELLY